MAGHYEDAIGFPDMQHESLLSWINPDSLDQASWISSYLSKKGERSLLGEFSILVHQPNELIQSLKKTLHDAYCREVIRGMRGAWHQKKYRERSGKQVSFQLPERVVDALDSIAKDRNQSRTQTLRQVVYEAAKQNQRERKQSREKIRKLENNLKKLRTERVEGESVRNRIINALSEKLAKEVMLRCCYEEAVGPMEDEELEENKGSRYMELLTRAISEIDDSVPDMKLLRSGIRPLRDFLSLPKTESDK